MTKVRLDLALVQKDLAPTRSAAANLIKLGQIKLNGRIAYKPSIMVDNNSVISLQRNDIYVSRAGYKLESASMKLKLNFQGKVVLDIGSSTGGFTQFALMNGASRVIAVDVGTNQLHPKLRSDSRIELHEKTDIRQFAEQYVENAVDIVLADVSFISLRLILSALKSLIDKNTELVVMCKPQFETEANNLHNGVVKNNTIRRQILNNFEQWLKLNGYFIMAKADSDVAGEKGNLERFYKLKKIN